MTQPELRDTTTQTADLLDALLGIVPGSALAQLRAQRPEATAHTQGSYDALFTNPSATTVSPAERFATALRVAALHAEPALVEHYQGALATMPLPLHQAGQGQPSETSSNEGLGASEELIAAVLAGPDAPGLPPRLRAILRHVNLLVIRPAAATPADLEALQQAGLSGPEIVTVSQIIAYVSFQLRVFAGLALLRGDERPAPAANVGPRDPTTAGFTQEQLGWAPWIVPFAADEASEEQRAVLPGQRINSPYFRLLALDPTVLGERTATDMGIFYTHGGLPRADRELAATAASRVNGCTYCASVHSRNASQLSGRPADVQRLLDEGITASLDERWRAVVDLAAALTQTPSAATQVHIKRLRDLGLAELEILDAVQAAAFFNWANRLMLTLGEPVPSVGA
jgi:alkylhydroperoxidase domain protein/CMD domain protein